MSQRTAAKDQKKKAYQQRLAVRRDREVAELMESFGFLSLFGNLPHSVKSVVRDAQCYDVEVVAGQSLECDPRSGELIDTIRTSVLTGRLPELNTSFIPLKNLYGFLACGMDACRSLGIDPLKVPEPGFQHPAGAAGEFTAAFARFYRGRFPQLLGDLWIPQIFWPLTTKSWPGERLYWPSYTVGPGPKSTFTIERLEPQQVKVKVSGGLRPTWPCFAVREPGKPPQPVHWRADQIGLRGDRTYPVHIQSHTTKRWRERLPDVLVHPMMFQHYLAHPVIFNAKRGSGLLTYGEGDYRYGYFTFTLDDNSDVIVLTTFLFLTMEGTPEFQLLRDRLGMERKDIEYNRLDQAERYFCSDLRFDSDLTQRLSDCGLGHLLREAPEIGPLQWPGFAAEIRDYFCLPSI
jgi:hypothetical protein